ncbi:uncharacterized protein SPSK_05044 [Sporothrix schenckii 1099-18]|uniref:DUF3835 domain-containing protein n=1 Tax=Sporothrix schenckii 1099-18 TaxID=1397361 RepID=A0A0F2LZ27_SPOSC|nr:uncharacterized protein SPSK_05044 [Sporothrix schenckii 1099-18]KJR81146.1 hypothetical protein SPSK_05044 [Sporothrix schenckii 1099-18]
MSQQTQPPLPQASALSQMHDLLANLQDRAAQLDTQMNKLSKALDHWRLLGAEYEALADEVNLARGKVAGDDKATQQAQQAALVRIRRDFDGQLVDHQTVCDLFGARQGQTITRSTDHIASAIGRRLDYVHQNTETLEKKVEAVVKQLSALQLGGLTEMLDDEDKTEQDAQAGGGHGDGGDLDDPVTDIVEQLDEDGNVIDVQLHTPSDTRERVREALKKAGIDEIPPGGPTAAKKSTTDTTAGRKDPEVSQQTKDVTKEKLQASKLQPNTSTARKTVSFSEYAKAGDSYSSFPQPTSFAAQRLENIMRSAKDQESVVDASTSVVPDDEPADEAALRREMLEYSISEIGPIVAQLDLEEGTSDDDEGYDDFYEEEYDDEDDDDAEDEHGRSKYSVIDETYRERMRELERKLGVAPLQHPSTLAPSAASGAEGAAAATTDDVAESLGRIRVSGLAEAAAVAAGNAPNGAPANANGDVQSPKSPASLTSVLKEPTENFRTKVKATGSDAKKVSFASSVDIAPLETVPPAASLTSAPASVVTKAKDKAHAQLVVDPMSEVIVERGSKQNGSSSTIPQPPAARDATQKPKRVSRFKQARGGGDVDGTAATNGGLPKGPHQAPVRFLDADRTVAPDGPEGRTHVDEVIERTAVTQPREPHELDASILMQEAATEYHKTRNRLIQQQGGFLQASESAVVPVGLDDGGPRISKFKAAKLGEQFMS